MNQPGYGTWQDQFFDGPPDIIGTVRGYRTWRMNETTGVLESPFRGHFWQSGMNTATCISRHRAPFPDCTCGFYSYYLPSSITVRRDVYGVIESQGAIELQGAGMRSEKARIVALCASGKLRRDLLANRYPLAKIYRSRRAMHRAFPPAKEVCGVSTHHVIRRFRSLRLVAVVMNGFIWAQFAPQIPHDWTNVLYPVIFTIMTMLIVSAFS